MEEEGSLVAKDSRKKIPKNIPKEILDRKGAARVNEVPKNVLKLLNQGKIETKNLCETLAVNQVLLYKNTLKELKIDKKEYRDLFKKSDAKIMTLLRQGALAFFQIEKKEATNKNRGILLKASKHQSDIIRSYAAFATVHFPANSFTKRAKLVEPFAADLHVSVKECAWMSLRPFIVKDFKKALPTLKKWAMHKDANIRRCAIEATRPRGVWCEHFELLKQKPELAESLIQIVHNDESRYVQNSVANWLNDSSKHKPKFVKKIVKKWGKLGNSKQTAYIIKRASRSMSN